jgi:hypothetical protein
MKPLKPYPASFLSSASDLARRYASDYRFAEPEFKGWLPGIGWTRLAGWLASQPGLDHLPAADPARFSLKDLTEHVAANCQELLTADRARFHSAFPPRTPLRAAVIQGQPADPPSFPHPTGKPSN